MKNLIFIAIVFVCIGVIYADPDYNCYKTLTPIKIIDKTELKMIDSVIRKSKFKKAKYIKLVFHRAEDIRMKEGDDVYINPDSTYYIGVFGGMVPSTVFGSQITRFGNRHYILPNNTPWVTESSHPKKYWYDCNHILDYLGVLPILLERKPDGRMTEVSDTTERYYFLIE
jgi:hypothetical protein